MLPNWHYTKKSLADVRCKSCLTYACHLIYTSLVVPTDCSNCLPKYQLCYIHDTGMSLYLLEIYGFNSYCYHCNHSQEYIQELKSLYRQEHKSTFQPQEKKKIYCFSTEIKDGSVTDLKLSTCQRASEESRFLQESRSQLHVSVSKALELSLGALTAGPQLHLTRLDQVQWEGQKYSKRCSDYLT